MSNKRCTVIIDEVEDALVIEDYKAEPRSLANIRHILVTNEYQCDDEGANTKITLGDSLRLFFQKEYANLLSARIQERLSNFLGSGHAPLPLQIGIKESNCYLVLSVPGSDTLRKIMNALDSEGVDSRDLSFEFDFHYYDRVGLAFHDRLLGDHEEGVVRYILTIKEDLPKHV
jgi:hypothetical protein